MLPDNPDADLPAELTPQLTAARSVSPKSNAQKKQRLLNALLTANSLKDAAAEAGVPYETARRYLREPEFQDALKALRRESADASLLDAIALAERARAALAAVLDDPHVKGYVKVRAAEVILNWERSVGEMWELHDRLTAIEQRLAEQQEQQQGQAHAHTPTYPPAAYEHKG